MNFNYTGPNPQRLYEKIKEILFVVVRHDPHELMERDFAWDRVGGIEKFKTTFDLVRDLDTFSYVQIVLTLTGEAKPSKEFGKEGTAHINMIGRLRTEYPQDTLWQRSLFYEMFRVFYHKIIYEDKRAHYREQCRDWMHKINDEIKAFLNVLQNMR
jgi:hypothetical protein